MTIDHVGVVGTGLMGCEIARVFTLAGKDVVLKDVDDERLTHALDGLGKVLDKGVQRGLYADVPRAHIICADDSIIAIDTSTISISGLAWYVRPERRGYFLGTHFFSPVSRMKVVEVISGLDT